MVMTALLISIHRAGAATGLGLDELRLSLVLQGTSDYSCHREQASELTSSKHIMWLFFITLNM